MKYTAEGPKLPKLPFIAGDLLLIATAVFIALRSASPIQPLPLLIIGLCVIVGAALLVVPFMADYARRQDAELNERQNQIAALARTTSESADQLSIAASGLHTIAEGSKQAFHAAEKLPGQLQARVDELTRQLAGASQASQNAASGELAELQRAVEKLTRAFEKSEAATKAKSDALAAAETRLAEALARAATEIDALVADAVTRAVRAAETSTQAKVSSEDVSTPVAADTKPRPAARPKRHEAAAAAAAPKTEATVEPAEAARTVEAPPVAPPVSVESAPVVAETNAAMKSETSIPQPPAEAPAPVQESASVETETAPPKAVVEVAVVEEPAPTPKAPRARKPKHDDGGFDLGLAPEPAEPAESSATSDGFTRLIATAYIGIGNKLFIRGEGPGLSWEKGVPLQFVSIGKWRWESGDVTAPVKAKLFKNDQVECVGLGTLTLEPGRHHEVNAGF